MEQAGLLQLPAKRAQKKTQQKPIAWTDQPREQAPVTGPLDDVMPIRVLPVTDKAQFARCNEFVDRYHYLGYKRPIGAHLRYFIGANGQRLRGWLSFSFAVRCLACRDQWIGWGEKARRRHLNLILNHNRFLLFAWVEVKCLASRVLASVARQISEDWQVHHGYCPVLLETLVEPTRFTGASYQAANWQRIGQTAGTAKPHAPQGSAPKDC